MSVVSSITVKGKTYSVTWAENQLNQAKNYLRQDTPRNNIKLQWSKPLIRDSRGKSVSFTARYTVKYGELNIQNTVTTTTFDSSKYGGVSKASNNWSPTFQATVTAVVKILGVSVNVGTARLIDNVTNVVPFNSGAKQIYKNDLDSQTVLPGTIRIRGDLPYNSMRGSSATSTLSPEFLAANPGFISVSAQYKLKTETTWKDATTTGFSLNDRTTTFGGSPEITQIGYKYNVIIPNPAFNKVYDIRTRVGLQTWETTNAIAQNKYQPTWDFYSLMLKNQIDNVIAVGDEFLAAPAMFDSEFPGKDRSKFTFANMITPVLDNYLNGTNTSNNEFSKDTTTTTIYKTGATSADIAALVRSIPVQPKNKNTLLIIHVGAHNLLKVAPNKMVSTAAFKSSLKGAITGFLAKNPYAEVRIMDIPGIWSNYFTQEEKDLIDTIEENEEYAQAWVSNAPNYFGTQIPLQGDGTNRNSTYSKATAYGDAMRQLATELSTVDNKRVRTMSSSISFYDVPYVQKIALSEADGDIAFSPSKFYPSATFRKAQVSEVEYRYPYYYGNFDRVFFTDKEYEERDK
jgi:hypothetical protein